MSSADRACSLESPRIDEPAANSLRGTTAVAMSGGLDSSVVAWWLAEQGESVIGLSMLLWDHSLERRNGRCCGALDLGDAKRVAEQAGVPHYTLRMDQEFREHVVDPFVNDYLAGRTPSPCVRCNTWIKFDLLLERAMALGADSVATGHYARIVYNPETDEHELHEANDRSKDQTYFLFELTQTLLSKPVISPLSGKSYASLRRSTWRPCVTSLYSTAPTNLRTTPNGGSRASERTSSSTCESRPSMKILATSTHGPLLLRAVGEMTCRGVRV